MDSIQSLGYFVPEIILLSTVIVGILVDLLLLRERSYVVGYWVLAGLFLSGFALWLNSPNQLAPLFFETISVDPFSRIFKFIILLVTVFVILISLKSDEFQSVRVGEYFTLLAASVLGMFWMVTSIDLIMVYLSIEVVSIISFILAGYLRAQARSTEASIKYVIYGAFSSGIMLYGFSLLFGLTGTTKIMEIGGKLHEVSTQAPLAITISAICIMAGFGYKISIVPFHFWTPDVYEGAPTPITAFLSVAPKAAGFGLLIRFFNAAFGSPDALISQTWQTMVGLPWREILLVISAATMLLGNLVAIQQSNIKRLLAYSSIAHAGYILMGVPMLSEDGIFAVIFYLFIYLFMQLGAFFVAIQISNKYGTVLIDEYKGIGFKAPILGLWMAVFMFSLTGIPPTSGFIGKFYLFAAVIKGGPQFYWLAVFGVLNSVVSLYYYMRVVKVMYFEKVADEAEYKPVLSTNIVLLFLGIPTILFGIYWSPIANWVQNSLTFLVVK